MNIDSKRIKPMTFRIDNKILEIIREEGKKDQISVSNLINKLFDLVLVHGDETFLPLSKSFPRIDSIKTTVIQTGYVVTPIPAQIGSPDIRRGLEQIARLAFGRPRRCERRC